MPAVFTKKSRHIDKVLEDARSATAHGGQLVVDALAREFGLWEKIRRCALLDPRKDKSRGFSPEAIVAQIVFSFCSGGVSLSDAGRLGGDKALGELLGMDRWAEETTIGEWLRGQNEAGLREIWSLIREFVGWVLVKAKAERVRRDEELEVFDAHRLKGAKEQGFHQLLGDMDLHHPPCLSSLANEVYYAIGALSFNLLMGVKVLYLADDQQGWTVRSLIRFWLTVPVKISSHAHRRKARIFVPKAALRWWRLFLQEHYPKRKPGRPPRDSVGPEVVAD